MALVFVHGVATRPSPEYAAETAQRDALFRDLVPGVGPEIRNPDWGSHAACFSENLPWLPRPGAGQAYGAEVRAEGRLALSLGDLAQVDVAQAVDLAVAAVLEEKVLTACEAGQPSLAADRQGITLAKCAATYLDGLAPDGDPRGVSALRASDNDVFAAALESQLRTTGALEAYGAVGDAIKTGFGILAGWVGEGLSDAALRAKRAELSRFVAFFLGDVFVYLRQRDVMGSEGTRERLFKPVLEDLVGAWNARRSGTEPLVVVGHSLGGVILFDLLTDPVSLARLEAEAPGFRIDLMATVGSQPGFFADLGLYGRKAASDGRIDGPANVRAWHNVYDYTDVFSFLAAPMFSGAEDFSYQTAVSVLSAHTTYFKRPSLYQRLGARLRKLGIS